MGITSAKYGENNTVVVVIYNGREHHVPVEISNVHYQAVLAWVKKGGVIEPADPPSAPPTNDELIDQAGPVLVAFIKAYAKRENLTMAQVKAAIINEMSGQ